jgi:anion-transporting  ArsA/GET3 family ATPase
MLELLADPATTALHVVTTPEEMPVNETIELVQRARTELVVPFGSVIVNRVLPEPFTKADEPVFEALLAPPARDVLEADVGSGAGDLLEATRLAVSMRRSRAGHLGRLRSELDVPLVYLPYLFVRDHGLRVTRMVADHLAAELGL